MKTLDQIEARTPISSLPYTITNRGSYYLTGNLIDQAGTNGIIIAADHVTVDLNGFSLLGGTTAPPKNANGSQVSLTGISVLSNCLSATIRNGTIATWGESGISATYSGNLICENLTVSDNTSNGITAGAPILQSGRPSDKCLIRNCLIARNQRTGISARGGIISNCVLTENTDGITIFDGQVRNCVIRSSYDGGMIASNSTVIDCDVLDSDEDGIQTSDSCRILNNRISGTKGSPGYGLRVSGSHTHVEGNTIINNNFGVFSEGTQNAFIKNTLSGNGTNCSITFPEQNTVGPLISTANAITNASPWSNITY